MIFKRLNQKMEAEISDEQAGLRQNRGTADYALAA